MTTRASRIIAAAVRTTALEKARSRGNSDPVLQYLNMNAEAVTRDVERALIAAKLLPAEDEQVAS